MTPREAEIFIDYQNIQRSGYEAFSPYGAPIKNYIVDPLKFAKEALAKREEATGETLLLQKV